MGGDDQSGRAEVGMSVQQAVSPRAASGTQQDPDTISQAKRYLLLAGGFIAVGLGAIGLVLPIVPTVPFLLVALACFSRSSRRFERRLLHHPRFGPPMRRWVDHGVIPTRAKLAATGGFVVSIASLAFFAGPVPAWIGAGILVCVAIFVWTRPSQVPTRS